MRHAFSCCALLAAGLSRFVSSTDACQSDEFAEIQLPRFDLDATQAHWIPETKILAKRKATFDMFWKRYYSHWRRMKGTMLSMPGLKPHEVTIQYEIELIPSIIPLNMTPELLLKRFHINTPDADFDLGELFHSGSRWWNIEVDHTGGKNFELLEGLVEPNSAVVHPEAVLNGSVPSALETYLKRINVTQVQRRFQFTLGLPLERVKDLLKTAPNMQQTVDHTAEFCRVQRQPCSKSYESVLLLCQMVLDSAATASACGYPKRYQIPWMLRNHMGDVVNTLEQHERDRLVSDVLQLLGGDRPLYPKGIMDYFLFAEMAEQSGLVKSRRGETSSAEEMPTEMDGMLKLAERMLKRSMFVKLDLAMRRRHCGVNAMGNLTWRAPTAREWLEGAQRGLDLMSDHDSPAAQASLSGKLWNSMGSWRWSREEPRIFLECREVLDCLDHPPGWQNMSYAQMLNMPARLASDLEAGVAATWHPWTWGHGMG